MTPRRAPRGEKPATTIAFQKKTIRDLTRRIDELIERNAELDMHRGEALELLEAAQGDLRAAREYAEKLIGDVESVQAKLAYETARASGYRQRVFHEKVDAALAEQYADQYPDLPPFPPGAMA